MISSPLNVTEKSGIITRYPITTVYIAKPPSPQQHQKSLTTKAISSPIARSYKRPPSSLEGVTVINNRFQISSNLIQTAPIENLLQNKDSVSSVRVAGNKHGLWEITLSADTMIAIKGLSFTTSSSSKKLPQTLRIYVSLDQETWTRVGKVYTNPLEPSTTYYITPTLLVRAAHIKIVFSDCTGYAELSNLKIYGS